MRKNIFEAYIETEYPPYAEWILVEADGDLLLADLIERREIIYDDVGSRGGLRNLDDDERQATESRLQKIYDDINERKRQLGIDLPDES